MVDNAPHQAEEAEKREIVSSMTYVHIQKGIIAKVLGWVRPKNTNTTYMFPAMAHQGVRALGPRFRTLIGIAIALMVATIIMIALLIQIPVLQLSVVKVLTNVFGLFLPSVMASALAWVVGLIAVFSLGTFIHLTPQQRQLDNIPANRSKFYTFILRLATWEEIVFRAGAEHWTWWQRIRMSLMFGFIHITNIWYSLAAGIALSLTGFGFMLVYLWAYKKYKQQWYATSVASVLHALYNIIALSLVAIVLGLQAVVFLIGLFT